MLKVDPIQPTVFALQPFLWRSQASQCCLFSMLLERFQKVQRLLLPRQQRRLHQLAPQSQPPQVSPRWDRSPWLRHSPHPLKIQRKSRHRPRSRVRQSLRPHQPLLSKLHQAKSSVKAMTAHFSKSRVRNLSHQGMSPATDACPRQESNPQPGG